MVERTSSEAEAEVVDLCETACDIAADFLGLSDDEASTNESFSLPGVKVQDVFEGIRVERQEVPLRTCGAHDEG